MALRIMRRSKQVLIGRAAALAGVLLVAQPVLASEITVVVDQAKVEKLPERVATLVVGNPLIADVTLQPGGVMVVTGKGYGSTNLIALDRTGAVLMEKSIQVQGPREGVVVMYRGVERESYSCTPVCAPRITLGDSGTFFDSTLQQSGTRNAQASAAGK
jgi:Flp pilus assembly secretin CpaC